MKKVLVIILSLLEFCQFSLFAKALDMNNTEIEVSQNIESQDGKKKSGKIFDSNQHAEIIDTTETERKKKQFLQTNWYDTFLEIGYLSNEGNSGIAAGLGMESKSKSSYVIWQNCFDLIYYKNDLDFIWVPAIFLGSYTIKIGAGIPLGIGLYSYTVKNTYLYSWEERKLDFSLNIGIKPSIKLTIKNVSFEAYYQYLAKILTERGDTIKSNEFGLILKFNFQEETL